jgi:hypothetical protein
MFRTLAVTALFLVTTAASAATQGGAIPVQLPLFPSNNWWNVDISSAPVDTNSTNYINFIGGPSDPVLHPDFGGDDEDNPGYVYGFPFIVVDGTQQKKVVDFVLYPGQSDGVGQAFYPVPNEAITLNGWVEGGPPGNVDIRDDSDRHILIVDKTNNHLYELYNVWWNGTQWEAGSGAFFDMNTNNRRPEGWTSADAAGLAILPGLVRYDEVFGPDEIRHALRFTVSTTNGHVYPASHTAGSTAGALPMGARLRLKASKNISSYAPEIQKIFRAFKKYGLILADNGSNMYISGVYDTRWNNDVLNGAFDDLKASDFEVIQLGWKPSFTFALTLPYAAGAGDAATATLNVRDINGNAATGYTGTVHFTSTDGAATLPVDYTFTAGDAGTHAFPAGVILRTPGLQTVTVTDTASAPLNASRGVAVGPATPTSLTANASSPTAILLSWLGSPGATHYEIARACTGSGFAFLTNTPDTAYNDPSAGANSVCVYKIRAVDASARTSSYTVPAVATTFAFTDDPLVAGVTTIKTLHFNELLQVANLFRTVAGLAAISFTAPVPSAGVTVRGIHVLNLRAGIDQARAALAMPALTYTDPTLTTIKAVHIQELRTALK